VEAGDKEVRAGSKRILGVGVLTLDIVLEVATHPREDTEVRALAWHHRRGGNAANTLAVLAQAGHRCDWVGVVPDDGDADFVLGELARLGIGHGGAVRASGRLPTSYICLSGLTGRRTIVHTRDLRELSGSDFAEVPLDGYDWVHFEGRNPKQTAAMVRRTRRELPRAVLSVELEKPRPGLDRLLEGPDVLLVSKVLAVAEGACVPEAFLEALVVKTTASRCFLAWGDQGGYFADATGRRGRSPAYPPLRVVDTLGAGDVFNAGVIDGLLRGLDPAGALDRGCRLAGLKCGQKGLDALPLDWDALPR